tara:strand:- start:206 stop:487 length:282 start_codon:yes stop_codon:yes gene_type:complete
MIERIKINIQVMWVNLRGFFGYSPETDSIPHGMYCYSSTKHPSDENPFSYDVKYCPYYKHVSSSKSACLYEGVITDDIAFRDSCKICSIKKPN